MWRCNLDLDVPAVEADDDAAQPTQHGRARAVADSHACAHRNDILCLLPDRRRAAAGRATSRRARPRLCLGRATLGAR
eukprot:scaffold60643_cov18-Phaeocystis_antarctica.AAC.1